MAQRNGKCINFGLCSMADSRESIPVAGGEDFSCPECGKPLTEVADSAASDGKNAAGGKKAALVAGLGLLLIAGTAYKFMTPADTNTKKIDTTQNVVIPPDTNTSVDPKNRKGVKIPIEQPPATHEERAVKAPPVRRNDAPGVMVARLLSPINTKTNRDGDTFSAIVENGPYRGQTLTGTIKKLTKNKKNAELQFDFEKLGGKRIPVQLDLVNITNSKGVKGVDDENNIVGKSSKTKVAIVTAAGVVVGAVLGKVFGLSKKETTLAALAGGGGGYLLSMKVMSRAQAIELNPGSLLTLSTR
jgi:hypothetical protein